MPLENLFPLQPRNHFTNCCCWSKRCSRYECVYLGCCCIPTYCTKSHKNTSNHITSCRTHQPFTDLLTRYHLQHVFYFLKWKTSFDPHLSRPRIFHQVTAICASKSFRVRSTRRLAMAATASGLTSGPWPGPAAGDRSMRSLRGATKCSFCVRRSCNLALAFPSFLAGFFVSIFSRPF